MKDTVLATTLPDPHSFAKPEQARVKHLKLDLTVNFDTKVLIGKAVLDIEVSADTDSIYLDTHDLTIRKITLDEEEKPATFQLGPDIEYLGQALSVAITPATKRVTVYYQTSPKAEALQWLTPAQTAGKKHPFLFTQSQAILARTWVPIQDSPGIRFTYEATVHVPQELFALMSASNPKQKNNTGAYSFKMEKPIPAYLLALSVGDLVFKEVGPRTGVYAEPVTLEKAAYEFAEMEQMLEAAEKLYGTYAWDRYDLLILPPSFPFGGMENPKLTFATPTILAGDRSLTSLVAHELAHSWSGNLVTNQTWNDFWLNEGFTVYFERRIMESLHDPSYAEMLAELGYQDLISTVNDFGKDSPDTQLKLKLEGRNPDDGVSDIAYEKGYSFLRLIEKNVGREKWDAFVKKYFHTFAFQSMNTERFLTYLKAELLTDPALVEKINVEEWIYKPGLPANLPKVNSARFDAVDKALEAWKIGAKPNHLPTKEWASHEWLHFVRHLPDSMTTSQMSELDEAFGFTNSGNSEILAAWFIPVIKHRYTKGYPALEKFLISVGRRKFIAPLYQAMLLTPEGTKMAKEIYAKARPNYHAVATGTLDALIK
jgi:leukotriene A-4 hydrolase/aminopeptidase